MATLKQLESQIKDIQLRNKRVESDKAWEISLTRKILIVIITYILIVIFFYAAQLPKPWINGIIPSFAFLLSTLTIPFIKKLWISKFHK